MKKQLVKVAPHILDLEEPGTDTTLFPQQEQTFLKLDRNEATISPSPLVTKAISLSLDSMSLNRHPDIKSNNLRHKLADYTGIDFDNIACFANQTMLLDSLTRTYLHPGLEALTGWPSDSDFAYSAASTGARALITQHADPFEPKIEEIISAVTTKTRLIYITNPNSITGAILTEAELVFLLSYAESAMVVIDESYFEFCGSTVADLISKYPNLAIIRTFAKAFALAGVDTAFLLTDSRNLRFINRLGYHKEPNMLAQVAAGAAIDDISYTANYVRQVNDSKKMLFDNLTRMGYQFRITASNFFLLKVNDPDGLVEDFTRNNIIVNKLTGIQGFQNHLRITIGTPSQTGVLLDVLARVASSQTFIGDRERISVLTKNRMKQEINQSAIIIS